MTKRTSYRGLIEHSEGANKKIITAANDAMFGNGQTI